MRFLFVFICVLYLGINGWLCHALLRLIPHWSIVGKVVVSIIYWLLAFSFILMGVFHKHLSVSVGHYVYWISDGWLAFFLYLSLSFAVATILKYMGIHIPYAFGWCMALTAILLVYGFIHFRNADVKHLDITLSTNASHSTMHIVAVSDIHLGYGINKRILKEYVKKINDEHPDLILIGGDLIDMSVRPLWEENMQEELKHLKAPMGIYMVPGNHEYISGIHEADRFIRETGITLLRDSIVELPHGIQLIGRDDRSNPQRKTVAQLSASLDRNRPTIILDHQPYNEELNQITNEHIDFGFFGHTHQGQFWPMNWMTDAIYDQNYGYRLRNRSHLYVSSGLGLWGPPFRIGTDSEMLVVDLHL